MEQKKIVILKSQSSDIMNSMIKEELWKKIKFIISYQKLCSDMDSKDDTEKLETTEISRAERLDHKWGWVEKRVKNLAWDSYTYLLSGLQ